MNPAPNLVLVGPMGAGKSSLAKRLASRLELQAVDVDARLEQLAGVAVPVIFVNEEDSPGLKKGGVLNVVRHELELVCESDKIPDEIEIEVDGAPVPPEERGRLTVADRVVEKVAGYAVTFVMDAAAAPRRVLGVNIGMAIRPGLSPSR